MPPTETDGFAQTYGVEILYERPPAFDGPALLRAVRAKRPAAEPLSETGEGEKAFGFVHADHDVALQGGTIHPQTWLMKTDQLFQASDAMEDHLRQSWSFPEAAQALGRARFCALLTDMMSSSLHRHQRLEIFDDVLAAVLELAPALAIHWRPAGRFVDPARWLEAYRSNAGPDRLFAGPMNVRLYNISNSPGDKVMDTLGLAALGVPDLQCHFRGLETSELATMLANAGCYLFDEGDVIQDDNTIEGIFEGSRWTCRHEESLLEPSRTVVDVDPGPPYVARGLE